MSTPVRNDQASVMVTVERKDGSTIKIGPMKTYSGAELTTNSAKTRAGAMGQEFDLGGQGTRSDASLTVDWTEENLGNLHTLEVLCGKAKATIAETWLDKWGDALDDATDTNIGILKGVSKPAYDTNGNAVGVMTLTIGMHEQAA